MANDKWIEEKLAVKTLAGDLIIDVLWNPKTWEATGDTDLYPLRVWNDGKITRAEVEKVR